MPHLYIECKDDGELNPADWNALYDYAELYGGVALLSSKADGAIRFYRLDARKSGRRGQRQPMTEVEVTKKGLVEVPRAPRREVKPRVKARPAAVVFDDPLAGLGVAPA